MSPAASMLLVTLHALAAGLALVVAVPVFVLAIEVLAGRRAVSALLSTAGEPLPAVLAAQRQPGAPRIAVLMPAHDEEAVIATPLAAVRSQLGARDRILVVADNCGDATADVARAAGAEVVERRDPLRRGKGYALDFGVRALASDPVDVVVIVDADCVVAPGTLEALAQRCVRSGRPVQALYLMLASGATLRMRIATFAWRVRNALRPVGARRLGWPCQLMGTGMAFPWHVIERAPLASGHLVEDLELGLALAASGTPPTLGADALVTSAFPRDEAALATQRTRWEQGHLDVIRSLVPRFARRALDSRSRGLRAMLLDVSVPPIAALVLVVSVVLLAALGLALGGAGLLAAWFATFDALLLVATLGIAWAAVGRDLIAPRELLALPAYVLRKVGFYGRALARRETEWVRTRRDDGGR